MDGRKGAFLSHHRFLDEFLSYQRCVDTNGLCQCSSLPNSCCHSLIVTVPAAYVANKLIRPNRHHSSAASPNGTGRASGAQCLSKHGLRRTSIERNLDGDFRATADAVGDDHPPAMVLYDAPAF